MWSGLLCIGKVFVHYKVAVTIFIPTEDLLWQVVQLYMWSRYKCKSPSTWYCNTLDGDLIALRTLKLHDCRLSAKMSDIFLLYHLINLTFLSFFKERTWTSCQKQKDSQKKHLENQSCKCKLVSMAKRKHIQSFIRIYNNYLSSDYY